MGFGPVEGKSAAPLHLRMKTNTKKLTNLILSNLYLKIKLENILVLSFTTNFG